MFDAPVDAWYVWVGLALVGAVALGTALELPAAPPPDAVGVATTVDTVAATTAPAAARYRLGATDARVHTHGISLRSEGGTAHATFSTAVLPVDGAGPLTTVALGQSVRTAFPDSQAFSRAVATARGDDVGSGGNWTAARTLYVRHVSWGETDVTLVVVQ